MLGDPTCRGCCYHSPPCSDHYQFCCQLVIYLVCIHQKQAGGFWTVRLKLTTVVQAEYLEAGIAASMSTILTDLYMVCETLLGNPSSPLS